MLVVACDSVGGIGPKSLDRIRVSGEVVGRFTARVVLMEVLSLGAQPFLIVSTLPVEPYPSAARILKGIRSELRRARVMENVPIMCSTEKNIPVRQTGLGLTVLASTSRRELRIGRSKPGDVIVAIGLPHVGSEVIRGEKKGRIVDLEDLLALLNSPTIHEIIPVGSRGILKEAKVVAKDSGLNLRLITSEAINLTKSAGPATVLLCSVCTSDHKDLSLLTNKPLTRIGALERPARQ